MEDFAAAIDRILEKKVSICDASGESIGGTVSEVGSNYLILTYGNTKKIYNFHNIIYVQCVD